MTLFASDRRSVIQNTEIVEFLVNEFVWNNPNCENQISDYVSLFIIFALNQNYDILSILMTSHVLFKCYDVWLDWELIYFHCGYTNFRAIKRNIMVFYYIILVMTHTKYFLKLLSLIIWIVSIWRWCTYQKVRNKIYMASKKQIDHRLKCRERERSKLNHITQEEKLQK